MDISRSELIGTTLYAGTFLSSLFGISKKIVIFPQRRKGSIYDAEFFHEHRGIYLDMKRLATQNDAHVIHSLGEEVGHFLHYHINPNIFQQSDPSKQEVIRSFKNQTHEELADKVLEASNLIEFIGFFSGLHLLSDRFDPESANKYAGAASDFYSEYIADDLRKVVEEIKDHAEKLQETYRQSTVAAREIETQILEGESELEKELSYLKHGFGYRLASKVYCLEGNLKEKCFKIALKSEDFSELCRKIGEKKIVSNNFFAE